MIKKLAILKEAVIARLPEKVTQSHVAHGELTLEVNAQEISSVCKVLRDDFAFNQLIDICGVDYLHYGLDEWQTRQSTEHGFSRGFEPKTHGRRQTVEPTQAKLSHPARYGVVYHLLSIEKNQRIRIRAWCLDDPPLIASVIDIWPSANWFEREAFDLFGIVFDGHPDLRRLLTDYGFVGHPFRKDFPLTGKVEVRYDSEKRRVVYEPTQIEPRVLVPRVIRRESSR